MSLLFEGKLLKAEVLPARGDFPASALLTLFDAQTSDTLNLIADAEVHEALASVAQFTDVVVELRWRRIDLNALGGQGRGKAYRLKVTKLVEVRS